MPVAPEPASCAGYPNVDAGNVAAGNSGEVDTSGEQLLKRCVLRTKLVRYSIAIGDWRREGVILPEVANTGSVYRKCIRV